MNLEEQQVINILKELLAKYDAQGSREVRDGHSRVSLFGKQLRFDLSKSFPLLTHRQFFVRGIFEELMWMLRGQTDNRILEEKNVYIWSPWNGIMSSRHKTDMGKIYGHQWRKFGQNYEQGICDPYHGFDQIEWVVNEIKTNPSSSRLIVSGWNPVDLPEAVLPCCHTMFQFFVTELSLEERKELAYQSLETESWFDGASKFLRLQSEEMVTNLLDEKGIPKAKLSCQLYQRSSDISLAGGFNIAQYALMTLFIAQQCNLTPGEFVWVLGDVHLYGNQIDDVREMVKRETHPFPQIEINKAKDLYSYEWSDIKIIDYKHSGKMENLKVAV